ncbi:hypothetical protein NMY22_g15496 [Coprinellus aureogranulatus]|nr:hypothetical protein NMY22_g15496 [Coprinellus aureogranulatus]
MTTTLLQYAHLLPPSWKTQVSAWLAEDTPSFDYGGFVVGEVEREAFLFGKGKEPAVLAGSPFVTEIFEQLGCTVEWHLQEGDVFQPVKHVATVRGKARHLLLGERVALNLMARCSGIATKSKRFRDLARGYGYKGIIAGTRKTTPGFRLVEKYGMLVDNHIWSHGSITKAIEQASGLLVVSPCVLDVEVRTEAEAERSHPSGRPILSWLDNMEGEELLNVASRLKQRWETRMLETMMGTKGELKLWICNRVVTRSFVSAGRSIARPGHTVEAAKARSSEWKAEKG